MQLGTYHDLRSSERTVGAALRGRPWFVMVFAKSEPPLPEPVPKPRAATEGRPYSTFRCLFNSHAVYMALQNNNHALAQREVTAELRILFQQREILIAAKHHDRLRQS